MLAIFLIVCIVIRMEHVLDVHLIIQFVIINVQNKHVIYQIVNHASLHPYSVRVAI